MADAWETGIVLENGRDGIGVYSGKGAGAAGREASALSAVRALAFDLDGTLLNPAGVVSPKTAESLKKAKEKGLFLALATGRDADSVKNLMEGWGISGLIDAIVGMGGAELCDFSLNREWAGSPLDGELIREIMAHYESLNVNFAIPCGGVLHAPKEDEALRMLAAADGVPFKVEDFDEFLKVPRPKVMIVCLPERMDEVIERSRSFKSPRFSGRPLKTASILFEYMSPDISKTEGLRELAGLHGFSMEEICAFGDADNDCDMVKNAGVGVAMENGSERTKAAADFVTGSNDRDGVGEFIEKYFL